MSTYYKKKFWDRKVGEAQKSFGGSLKVLLFCISIGELDAERDFAFPCKLMRVIVRRTTSFCNKELQFFLLEKVWWTVSNALLWIC